MADSNRTSAAEPDWRRILDAVNDCVWSAEVDLNGQWIYHYVSPAIERIAGRPASHFLAGRNRWLDCVHSEDRSRVLASDMALPHGQRDARDAEYRFRLVRPDGTTRWVRDIVRVSPGTKLRLDGVLADVTEQYQAEAALRGSEDRLRRIVDTNPDAVLLVGTDRRITLANPAAARLFGFRRTELVGQSWEDLGIEQEPIAADQSVLRGQQYSIVRPDGTRARVLLTMASLKGPDGDFAGFVATFDDVTALSATTDQLARSEARARILLQQVPAIVWSIDKDQRFTSSQGQGLKELGLAPDQVVGMTVAEMTGSSDPSHPSLVACRKALSGTATNFDSEMKGRGYTTYIEPLLNERGQVCGATAISLDVTRTRELENRLRAAGRLDALGQLAGGAAHDINNLLTALMGHLSRAREVMPESAAAREPLDVCAQAATRAAGIARQLLGVARGRSPVSSNVDVNAIAREVLALLAPVLGADVHAIAALAAGPLLVRAEAGQIHQILINLCVNARDAMATGGRLTISTVQTADDRIRIIVSDTGIGMTDEIKARIFEPLFTTKGQSGTGLGLVSVMAIVRELNGHIRCDSEPGRGTRFEVDLPAAEADSGVIEVPSEVPAEGSETILIVEDEPHIRSFARQVLEDAGYTVHEAADGMEAVALFERDPSPINLAILDLSMPRLGGREAFARLSTMQPGLRALFSSGLSAGGRTDSSQPGVMGYLEKPYRLTELLSAVRRALDSAMPS